MKKSKEFLLKIIQGMTLSRYNPSKTHVTSICTIPEKEIGLQFVARDKIGNYIKIDIEIKGIDLSQYENLIQKMVDEYYDKYRN